MALPMFASDITFGGDMTFGFVNNFSDKVETEKTDLTFDVKAAIDDFNSLEINLDGLEIATAGGAGTSKGLVTTDVGKWLDLPIGLKVNWGYDDPDWNAFAAITHYDALSIYLSPDEYWGVDVVASYKMLEFEFAINPGAANNLVPDMGYLLAGVAIKEPIKGLSAEVYYFQGNSADPNVTPIDTLDAGTIAADAVYAMEFGDLGLKVGPGFAFYLTDDPKYGAWRWFAGAKATYKNIEASTELTGWDGQAFALMDAVAKVKLMDKFQPYAGIQLSFVDGTDAFQGADVGVACLVGATTMSVGYLITSNGANDIGGNYSPTLTNGGLYFLWDMNY
jgi:hypothetical protein